MSVLPRLDYLVRLAIGSRHNSDWVLDRYAFDRRVDHSHEEIRALLLSSVRPLFREPSGSATREMSAWWKRNHHVPAIVEDI
jgi:hypothetical protein